MSTATREVSRWGGECYKDTCPFHYKHFKGEEPLCNAETIELTEEAFQTKAVCKQEDRKELGL